MMNRKYIRIRIVVFLILFVGTGKVISVNAQYNSIKCIDNAFPELINDFQQYNLKSGVNENVIILSNMGNAIITLIKEMWEKYRLLPLAEILLPLILFLLFIQFISTKKECNKLKKHFGIPKERWFRSKKKKKVTKGDEQVDGIEREGFEDKIAEKQKIKSDLEDEIAEKQKIKSDLEDEIAEKQKIKSDLENDIETIGTSSTVKKHFYSPSPSNGIFYNKYLSEVFVSKRHFYEINEINEDEAEYNLVKDPVGREAAFNYFDTNILSAMELTGKSNGRESKNISTIPGRLKSDGNGNWVIEKKAILKYS